MKPSDVLNVQLIENAKEREAGGDSAYTAFLQTRWAELTEALGKALAKEAAADRAVAAAGLRNMAVTTCWPDALSMSDPAAAEFLIEWEAPRWNWTGDCLEWAAMSVTGFHALPPKATAYMLETCPEVLPDIITDLAPHDPAAALAQHLASTRRTFN